MLIVSERGSSLVEVLIASAIGAIVVMAAQQQMQWQTGVQHHKLLRVNLLLSAQSVANQFFETLKNTVATQISNPQGNCYLFPQQNGGSVGFRVRNEQLQHNSMTLDCAGYGWQSLTDKSQFKVTHFAADSYSPGSGSGLSKLVVTFTVTNNAQTHVFKRTITPLIN
jgi:prepilin peptidase dependent protein B